jgi:DNA-binding MurR/RpiR family transcriptional regulator
MAKSILHTIESNQSGFSKGQKRIAAYILQNYDKAAFMTASKLGTLVGVSESTVVRFATELGYDGYPSMQRALQEMIRSRLTSTQRIQAADDRLSGQDLLSAVMHSDMDKLRMVVDEADRREFNRVVDLIMQARHIYILGVRSSYFVAGYLNFYMHLLFDNATLVQSNAAGEIFEQLFRIGPGDVMIAISFPRYSQVTVNTVKFAKDRGATIVAITDSEVSPLRQAASAALLAPSEMISFVDSMVAPLSMINALLVALGYRLGKDISATFAELESIWNEYGDLRQNRRRVSALWPWWAAAPPA